MATSTSFSSSSSSTRLLTGKSLLRGPRTPETVSQYSFHIVNAAVTGLRTSARLFTGDLVSPTYHHRRLYVVSTSFPLPKNGYYLRETKALSFVESPPPSFPSSQSHSQRQRSIQLVFSTLASLSLIAYLYISPSAPEIERRA